MCNYLLRVVFCLLIIVCNLDNISAAELHVIIVCDTDAIDLEDGVEHDYRHIKKELKKVAKLTGLELSMQTFTGRRVDSSFLYTIRKLQANPDDVIVFYWSGHGTRFDDQAPNDPWPYFDFEYDDDLQSLLDVTKELMKKEARLVLSIADCCNDYDDQGRVLPIIPKTAGLKPPQKASQLEAEGYKKLFLEARGVYIATAALPGESSIALDESDDEIGVPGGSFFTNAIIDTIHTQVKNYTRDLSWDTIFDIAVVKAIEYQLKDLDDPVIYHHPHYQRL